MTDSEIARLEEWLRVKLPEQYVALLQQLTGDMAGLSGPMGQGVHRPFMIGFNEVLSTNRKMREAPQSDWPDHLFVCGFEQVGNVLYAIDCRQKEPRLLQILSKSKDAFPPSSKKLEPCAKLPDLKALCDYSLEKYRRFAAKSAKGKPKPAPRAAVASSKTKDKPAPQSKAPTPGAIESMAKLLQEAGFELASPRRKHTIAALTEDAIAALPENLHALYTLCDGGRCDRLKLKILPLHEAVDAARAFATAPEQGSFPMGYFPFLTDINADSDLCCVCTKGPLKGYVIHVHHDELHAVKARTLEAIFGILSKNLPNEGWRIDDADYEKRPREHVAFEFAGDQRTPSDLKAARELLNLAEVRLAASDHCQEYEHLVEIALKLFSKKQTKEIAKLLTHADQEFCRHAQLRLAELGMN